MRVEIRTQSIIELRVKKNWASVNKLQTMHPFVICLNDNDTGDNNLNSNIFLLEKAVGHFDHSNLKILRRHEAELRRIHTLPNIFPFHGLWVCKYPHTSPFHSSNLSMLCACLISDLRWKLGLGFREFRVFPKGTIFWGKKFGMFVIGLWD